MPIKTRHKILLDHTTPTKRMLVQTSSSIMVLSECCAKGIVSDGDEYTCTGCSKVLKNQDDGNYVSSVTFLDVSAYSWYEGWGNWLEFWFGLKDGEIEFTNLKKD